MLSPALFLARSIGKPWKTPHVRIIYFHGVPRESLNRFVAILDHFGQMFHFSPYSVALDLLAEGRINRPTMVLTFDDADQTVHDNALPVLADRAIKACIFAVADYVEKGTTYREKQPRAVMNWPALEKCLASGWEIGNHTYSHPNLTQCSEDAVLHQLERNKKCIETQLKCPVVHFAYPYGQFNTRTINIIRKSGLCATQATTQRGQMRTGFDSHFLRRDRIDLHRTPEQIEALMRLADRLYWMRHLRRLAKLATRRS